MVHIKKRMESDIRNNKPRKVWNFSSYQEYYKVASNLSIKAIFQITDSRKLNGLCVVHGHQPLRYSKVYLRDVLVGHLLYNKNVDEEEFSDDDIQRT